MAAHEARSVQLDESSQCQPSLGLTSQAALRSVTWQADVLVAAH